MTPLIAIVGPTGSGKSALALQICQEIGGEIICADSRTIYKGLNIGTGKPTLQDQSLVRHHLLDLAEPDQPFTVADFKKVAVTTIDSIWQRGNWPVLVGGSGLYVDAVLFDYSFGPPSKLEERQKYEQMTIVELQQEYANRHLPLPENDKNRRYLIRGLEMGGLLQHSRKLRTETCVVGITINPDILKGNLHARALSMIENGVVNEAKTLSARYGWEIEPMKSNIYQVLRPVVEGQPLSNDIVEQIVTVDMRLAKKQMTWFKRNKAIQWGTPAECRGRIKRFIRAHTS